MAVHNRTYRSRGSGWLLSLLLGLMFTAGCGAQQTLSPPTRVPAEEPAPVVEEEISVQTMSVEDSEELDDAGSAAALQVYLNNEYGFQFSYPESWRVSEEDHQVIFSKGGAQLRISYRWKNESEPEDFGRSGLPAGDRAYRGTLTLEEQQVPIEYLVYDNKIKMVLYNQGKPVEFGDLQLVLALENLSTDYESVNLPLDTAEEARLILESFQVLESESAPPTFPPDGHCSTETSNPHQDWEMYKNDQYGFYFPHPPGMQIEEEDHFVKLHQGDLTLVIEYRAIDDQYAMPGHIPEGEVELLEFKEYFDDQNPNPIMVERTQGQVTRVSIGNVISPSTPVQFLVSVVSASGAGVDVEQAVSLLEAMEYLCLQP